MAVSLPPLPPRVQQVLGNPRVQRGLKYALYPAFYLFVLVMFLFWTFPYDRLKERIIGEFNARQPAGPGVRMEIDEMSSYWMSGIEAEGVRLVSPPGPAGEDGKVPAPKVVTIDELHARVSLLSYIFGTTSVAFGANAFGGELSGNSSQSSDETEFNLDLGDVNVGELPMLAELLELPLGGALSGTVQLTAPEGKFAKATGRIDLTATGLTVGDGKAKIKNALALPTVDAGQLTILGEADDGRLKFEKFTVEGKDLELVAEGQIRLRDPANTSLFEMNVRFKFSDAYRNKNETTRSLLGAPGSKMPALFELDPKVKRAKRPDGFYSFRVSGPLSRPTFSPAPQGGTGAASATRANRASAGEPSEQ